MIGKCSKKSLLFYTDYKVIFKVFSGIDAGHCMVSFVKIGIYVLVFALSELACQYSFSVINQTLLHIIIQFLAAFLAF